MEPPVTEEGDIIGSSFFLNLIDAFHGVEIIEEHMRTRKAYNEISSIMCVGMVYSLLHNSSVECKNPTQRRELLLMKFQEVHSTFGSGSRNVRAKADIIDALTVKLPNLRVTVLPVQFRKIKDPMEIIKLVITSQVGAYLNVDELIETAKLLGLSFEDNLSVVQEAIAREAAVAGDLQLAFDLCLVLTKEDHCSIWDLCATIERGPDLENMDVSSRKQLLAFALSYCNEESIGELLAAWKDLDMQGQCEKLMMLAGTHPPKSANDSSSISFPLRNSQDTVDLRDYSEQVDGINCDDQEANIKDIKNILYLVAKDLSKENGSSWEALLGEHDKILSLAALRLPWLLELTHKVEHEYWNIPGVETTCFVSGDINYIESSIFFVSESVKLEKEHLLKNVLKLADTYGLNHTKVLLEYLCSALVSDVWALDDIIAEISEFKNEILGCAAEAIKTISLSVCPVIHRHDKQRLAYVFGLLSNCYFQVDLSKELLPKLEFQNIVGLDGLNFKFFTSEIYAHVDEYSVEALTKMVQTLITIDRDPLPEDLISWKAVYIHHVLCLLKALEVRLKTETEFGRPEKLHDLISELEKIYDACRKYVRVIAYLNVLDIMVRFFTVIIPLNKFLEGLSNDLA
ncbi:hypothetical protein U1Q18_009683 [Sarracenia purpurea var. burkii]